MTRADIAAVLEREPLLNSFGIGLFYDGVPRTILERATEIRKAREELLASEEECTLACEWLTARQKVKMINRSHSSYGYKHMVENAVGRYISNGAFIAAAIHCGFPYRTFHDSPNVLFGISEKSLKGQKET